MAGKPCNMMDDVTIIKTFHMSRHTDGENVVSYQLHKWLQGKQRKLAGTDVCLDGRTNQKNATGDCVSSGRSRCPQLLEEGDKYESSFLRLDRCYFLALLRVVGFSEYTEIAFD